MSSDLEIQDFPLWDKLEAKRAPISFDLEVTARCNNDCRHCYINLPAGDRAAQAAELTAAEILDIAGQAAAMGAVWCLLTGGEPLLRDDFAEMYLASSAWACWSACSPTPAWSRRRTWSCSGGIRRATSR